VGVTIDLNCDLGEGAGHDAELMPLVTSANIACGAHAGDLATMRATVALALAHGVAIGAHPGLADRQNFGRREIMISPREAGELVLTQWQALAEVASAVGARVTHLKLHGALYNMTAREQALAEGVLDAVRRIEPRPILVCLAGSVLERLARGLGDVRVAAEVFADRTYQRDGALTPRTQPGALIEDPVVAVAQVLRMVRDGEVRATDGTEVPIRADTLCLHGDGPHAVEFARGIRKELATAGVEVRAFRR
jgi:UPF0271 protein